MNSDFDSMMEKVSADEELRLLKAKMEDMRLKRNEASRKYHTKRRENDPEFCERMREKQRNWYRSHMAEIKAMNDTWNKSHPEKISEINKRAKDRIKALMASDPEYKAKMEEKYRIYEENRKKKREQRKRNGVARFMEQELNKWMEIPLEEL